MDTGASAKGIADQIKKEFPDHYELREDLLLVSSELPSNQISEKIGFGNNDEGQGSGATKVGVVLSLDKFHAGFESQNLWQWLKGHTEK